MSDFDVLSLLNVRSVKLDLMVNEEKNNVLCELCSEESINTSLNYLSVVLDKDGNHSLHSFLSYLPCSVLRNLELDANKFTI